MELSSLFDSFAGAWGDEILFWVVAAVAGAGGLGAAAVVERL